MKQQSIYFWLSISLATTGIFAASCASRQYGGGTEMSARSGQTSGPRVIDDTPEQPKGGSTTKMAQAAEGSHSKQAEGGSTTKAKSGGGHHQASSGEGHHNASSSEKPKPIKAPSGTPAPGLHAYTKAHASDKTPPDRLGGKLNISVTQKNGSTRLVLPGPRFLDPSVFGSPSQSTGFDPAPFPLLGVPKGMRKTADGEYTFVDHATPFSDWYEVGQGSVNMQLVDHTAIDGAKTKDKIKFEATFKLPDGAEYRVVAKKPLPHGLAFPTFGGVASNHLLHGVTGIGTRLMPTEYTYAAFWGVGKIYKNGELINDKHMVHAMVTEIVRGEGYELQFDGGVGKRPGKTLHLMIPPYKPVKGEGMVKAPLKTNFMPFPYVKKNLKADMKAAMKSGDQDRIARLKEIKKMMGHTKQHVIKATKAGKMYGMPFIHIMFGNINMTTQ